MQYPLELKFKLLAIASQIYVSDASGQLVFYVKQKAFKLKEAVTVYSDEGQSNPRFTIQADRIIDFSAHYHFATANGQPFGSIKRQGMRSLWKAHYEISDGHSPVLEITEGNPWIKVLDGLVSEIPVVGFLVGYFLHPSYNLSRPDGTVVMKITKRPSLFEGRFTVEKFAELDAQDEARAVLGMLMMVLLERSRG
jgi:uncharacterized protein YxjI